MTVQKRLGVFCLLPFVGGARSSTPYQDSGLCWLFDKVLREALLATGRSPPVVVSM